MAAISFQPYATLQQQSMLLVGEPLEVTLFNFNLNTLVTLELVSANTGATLSDTADVKFESLVVPTSNVHVVPITFLQTTHVMMEDEGLYIRAYSGNAIVKSRIFHVVLNVLVCNGVVRVDTTEDVQDVEVLLNMLHASFRLTDIQRQEIARLRLGILNQISCPESPMFAE